ncbi:hypothetical protein [Pseudoalteromonas prydzensis]|uniref:hypothetical protein n=1 Tax=Pseudoalteromonas prydzensis TaxID=182141 RepID=UPI0007E528C2|nr:hypothetical protein [Pseudoalteromonas prydzensis]MBE0379201.1 hypothetical protein [Pseudoalteromonas prydzensis ACAM 620]
MAFQDLKLSFTVDNSAVMPLFDRLRSALEKLEVHVANLVRTNIEELMQKGDLVVVVTHFNKDDMSSVVCLYPSEGLLRIAKAVFDKRYEDLLPELIITSSEAEFIKERWEKEFKH